MGISERKERDKLEMRLLILNAATKMFLEDGYDKTSIRSIAELIEYSPATIYLYFKDKDEIFLEIHNIGFELLFNEFKKSEILQDPVLKIKAINKAYIEFALNNPEYYDLMFIMRGPIKRMMEERDDWQCGKKCFNYFLEIVTQAIDQQRLKPMDKYVASVMLWSSVHGLISLAVRDRFKVMELEDDVISSLIYASSETLMGLVIN
jgi:AcrR family transcriptional regulator